MYTIDWSFPEPRKGAWGVLDRFVGPGATKAENILQFTVPFVAALAAVSYSLAFPLDWTWFQYAVASVLALDLSGGVVTNATSSAKRWFHRAGQSRLDHGKFILLHFGHLILVCWLFGAWDLTWMSINMSLLAGATLSILWSPLYLQRPVAYIAFGVTLMLTQCVLSPFVGLEWFLPLFYLKLLVSHLLLEAPFRPHISQSNDIWKAQCFDKSKTGGGL